MILLQLWPEFLSNFIATVAIVEPLFFGSFLEMGSLTQMLCENFCIDGNFFKKPFFYAIFLL